MRRRPRRVSSRRPRVALSRAAVLLGCASAAGCGSSGPKLPVATRVCRGDRDAVQRSVGAAKLRIVDADPSHIECLLIADRLRVDVNAQALAQAWTQFDTVVVHAAQANGPGGVHNSSSLPVDIAGLGYSAAWIPAQNELFATNGSQSQGGSYVTVVVSGHQSQAVRMQLAEKVATATLANAPRGPSPGPAPS